MFLYGTGLYGDNLNEMAWAVGQVLGYLKEKNLDKNTLVVFISDHGPHEELCQLGGVSGEFTGGKSHSWEGGFRIPAIFWFPGTIGPGTVSRSILSTFDLLPTFIKMAGGNLPDHTILDGVDSTDCILGSNSCTNSGVWKKENVDLRLMFFYCNDHLMAVRYGKFKVHFFTIPLKPIDREMQCPGGIHIQHWYYNS